MQLASNFASALPGLILTLSIAAVFVYGGSEVIAGTLSLGGLMAFGRPEATRAEIEAAAPM